LRRHVRPTWIVEFSRERDLLASASSDSIRIWNLAPSLGPSMLPAAPGLFGTAIIVSQDGSLTLRAAGRKVTLDQRFGNVVVAGAFSKDGNRVLVAEKTTLKLYDLRDSRLPLAKFEVPRAEWKAVGFLDNPNRMVAETTDGKLYSWPYFK